MTRRRSNDERTGKFSKRSRTPGGHGPTSVGSANFEQWSGGKIWSDAKACVGELSRSHTGTLDHPHISDAGRKFLADLLVQLTDAQLHDLFEVARFPERTGGGPMATVDEWVGAFKQKRDEIAHATCPA